MGMNYRDGVIQAMDEFDKNQVGKVLACPQLPQPRLGLPMVLPEQYDSPEGIQ